MPSEVEFLITDHAMRDTTTDTQDKTTEPAE